MQYNALRLTTCTGKVQGRGGGRWAEGRLAAVWWMEVVVGLVAIVVVVVFCLDHKPADALDSLGAWMFSATVRLVSGWFL